MSQSAKAVKQNKRQWSAHTTIKSVLPFFHQIPSESLEIHVVILYPVNMRTFSVVCLIAAVFVSSLSAQSTSCFLCELIVNEVLHMHPGGVASVPDNVLLTELGQACDKYLSSSVDQNCHQFLAANGASFVNAMRMYNTAFAVCHAPPASVC